MKLGRVCGRLWATAKDETLEGQKIFVEILE